MKETSLRSPVQRSLQVVTVYASPVASQARQVHTHLVKIDLIAHSYRLDVRFQAIQKTESAK
ncbi:MAG TPA: hypothetical protein V6C50_08080 [Crinalium sp.]